MTGWHSMTATNLWLRRRGGMLSSWAERDQVLAALLERAIDDGLARRVALQVVLPGLKSLINGIRGWDVEERAARVVATALDVISWCATEPAGTPPSFRIYANTRRRVLRSAVRARSEPVVFVDDYWHLDAGEETTDGLSEDQQVEQLVEWVRQTRAGSRGCRPPGGDDPGRRRFGG